MKLVNPIRSDPLLALAKLAQSGDRQAANELAQKVTPWAARKAGEYAATHQIDQEELLAVGLSTFPAALRDYDETFGGFLNYFACASARAMLKAARKEISQKERHREHALRLLAQPLEADSTSDPDDEPPDVHRLLNRLSPLDATIVAEILGLQSRPTPISQLAVRLGLSVPKLKDRYQTSLNQLSQQPGEDCD
jgi:DNA-directed RNA polymerase specialized sigma24 family protein